MRFRCNGPITVSELAVAINAVNGTRLGLLDLRSLGLPVSLQSGQTWDINGAIETLRLVEGDYSVSLTVNTGEFWENVADILTFSVPARIPANNLVPYPAVYRGLIDFNHVTTHSTHAT